MRPSLSTVLAALLLALPVMASTSQAWPGQGDAPMGIYRAALHVGKPKKNLVGRGSLTAIILHNYRKDGDFAHIDASRSAKNQILVGTTDGIADVRNVLSRYKPARKDSPLYFEMVMTAHQDFFSKKRRELRDKFPEFLRAWADANVKWAKRHFDGRGKGIVVNAILHLDEQSPHIHIIVVPVVDMGSRGKRICHTHVLGAERGQSIYGNPKMIELQDTYGLAMEPFGLARGERGSRVKHQEPADYRKRLPKDDRADYEAALDTFGVSPGTLAAFAEDLTAGLAATGQDFGQVALQGASWWWGGDDGAEAQARPRDNQTQKMKASPASDQRHALHNRQPFNPASAPAPVATNVGTTELPKTSEVQGMGI